MSGNSNRNNIRRMTVMILITVLSFMLCACGQSEEKKENDTADKQEYIGIIAAMSEEKDLLVDEAEIDHTDTIGGLDFHVGTLCGKPVVIAGSGIGKVLSSSAMTAMLNNYDISKVIFTGVAGGVSDDVKVLDVVVADKLVQHDYGTITNDGFEWTYGNTGEEVGDEGWFYSDPELADLAYESAVKIIGEDNTHRGVIATGDQFIVSEDYVEKLQEDFDALACEMEGAAIASVCSLYDKPFVIIRAMSDKADGKAHETYENFMETAADNSSRIVMEMLKSM